MTFVGVCAIILSVKHADKKNIIESLLVVPKSQKRLFWGREIKHLNFLLKSFPCDLFWKGLSFSKQFESLALLRSGHFLKELKKKYKRFNYKIPNKKELKLGKKSGDDYITSKTLKTKRDFLS